jgi:hypothetical protein
MRTEIKKNNYSGRPDGSYLYSYNPGIKDWKDRSF